MELQIVLNTYAKDIFRNQADCDYIAARANFRMQLRQQFLWSSQQCIEKYLKAILLFNGRSARYVDDKLKRKEYSHDIALLIKGVECIKDLKLDLPERNRNFLDYLAVQGVNRYLVVPSYNTMGVLEDLDSTVWHIRRYCQYMADRPLGQSFPTPGLREASIAAALNDFYKKAPYKFRLQDGYLEKVLKKPKEDPARKALVWANFFYGKVKKSRVIYRAFSSSEIPPSERGWKGVDWGEVNKYVKL